VDERSLAQGPLAHSAIGVDEELDREHLERVRAFEVEHGRPMLPSELERHVREFYAPHYREEMKNPYA
jgi:hypothetical protein